MGNKKLFASMFGIITLLNIGYALLRGVRNTLAVVDLGGGAGSIPFYEICGSMPGAVLMTLGLAALLNRFSIQKVFFIAISFFVGFFLAFVIGIYPFLSESPPWVSQGAAMLFFAMAELWKIALLTVLFWGLVNQYLPFDTAKKFYAPLMLGGSLGSFLSGPLISFCTRQTTSWTESLVAMMVALAFVSGLAVWLFFYLWKAFAGPKREQKEKQTLSVWESVQICFKSRYLLLLGWITIADYIAYTLGEVIFLDVAKQFYPSAQDYCRFMGKLNEWIAILTFFSALVVTPLLLKRFRWVVASLITPICLLLTLAAFFFTLWHPKWSHNLSLLVFLGSLLYCLVRGAKYTLFDTSKEISFLLLPPLEKMQGKLVIDGMCSRIGRGSASILSISLIQICGGVLAASTVCGVIAIGIAASCAFATLRLGQLVDKKNAGNVYRKI